MGIEQLPIRYPSEMPKYLVQFFQMLIRDVFAKADIRNSIGIGVSITGNSSERATIALDSDIAELADSDFVLADADPSLPNARTIAGETGVLGVSDSGPGGQVTISITVNGVTLDKLAQSPASTFLGNSSGSTGSVSNLSGATATSLLNEFTDLLKGLAPASGGGTVNFLRADGTWNAPSGPVGANPSASVGLSAVNGSAPTFMRSDGAPALDQGITPTWTALHIFSAGSRVTGSASNATGLNLKYSADIGTVRAHNGSNATLSLESEAGIALEVGGNTALSVASNRRVSIAAPSSGTTLQLTAVSAGTPVSASDGTVTGNWNFSGTTMNVGTTSNHALNLWANNAVRLSLSTTGVLTLANYGAGYLASDGSGVVSANASIPYSDVTGGPAAYTPSALTKSDDTNVTLTLGGTPATSLLQATSLTLGWAGTLAKSRGGFGEDASGLTASIAELNYTDGVTSAIQTQIDGKQASSAVLTAYAGGDTPSSFTLGIVDSADAAAWRTAIGAADSSGAGTSNTYTPTGTNITNTSGITSLTGMYMRIGNIVQASGTFTVTTTTIAATSRVAVSLPVASNFGAITNLVGAVTCRSTLVSIGSTSAYADTTNDRAELQFVAPASAAAHDYSFWFQYEVI